MNLDQASIETWLEGIVRKVVREEQLPAPKPVSECMTRKQCAAYFQVSEVSIFNWQNRREAPLPHAYVGDEPRYYLAEVQQWSRDEAVRRKTKTNGRRKPSDRGQSEGTIRATLTAATEPKGGSSSASLQAI